MAIGLKSRIGNREVAEPPVRDGDLATQLPWSWPDRSQNHPGVTGGIGALELLKQDWISRNCRSDGRPSTSSSPWGERLRAWQRQIDGRQLQDQGIEWQTAALKASTKSPQRLSRSRGRPADGDGALGMPSFRGRPPGLAYAQASPHASLDQVGPCGVKRPTPRKKPGDHQTVPEEGERI